jgi:hypothetical protein
MYIVGHDVAGSGAGWGLGTLGLGGSVDVPALLSERGGLTLGVVCITASTVGVAVVWVLACTDMVAWSRTVARK